MDIKICLVQICHFKMFDQHKVYYDSHFVQQQVQ